jgi:hypothetical protein
MVTDSVVKYNSKAQENETAQSIRIADYYLSAIDNNISFFAFSVFSVEAIVNAFDKIPQKLKDTEKVYLSDNGLNFMDNPDGSKRITPQTLASNKLLIPESYRQYVVDSQIEIIIRQYEAIGDSNNYYRMLNGLPNYTTDIIGEDYVKLPDDVYIRYNIDPNLYIHQLSSEDLRVITTKGILDEIISNNPDKPYLKFLGNKKISPVKARRANNFSLLYVPSDDIPTSFYEMFNRIYEQNREYVCTVLYNKQMSDSYKMYDNFMGMCVMFMTIQRVVALSFRQGINRDLYDWDFIQKLYSAYNIPFNESINIDTHITMVKNFNHLLRYKASDKVFFDLMSLLGYTNVEFEKYYLVKNHRKDAKGNPLFDDNGNPIYELYFKSVGLNEDNVALAIQDKSNTKSYDEVIESDPLWWDSDKLRDDIMKDEFNYVESKYISINMMYNMSEILFNITYAIQLIFSKKEDISNYDIALSFPKLNQNKRINLFDIAVFIVAGICKIRGFAGNTMATPNEIYSIYAYDNDSVNNISVDNALYQLVHGSSSPATNWSISSAEDFDSLFNSVKDLDVKLVDAMWNTDNIDDYLAYRSLYETAMTKQAVNTMFTKKDGTIADTYLDYLRDTDINLYTIIEESDSEELYDIMNHAVGRLQEQMDSIRDMEMLLDSSGVAYEAIISLIDFFKSYTIDIHSFNVWYLFDSKAYNTIRTFHAINNIDSKLYADTDLNFLYGDNMHANTTIWKNHTIEQKHKIKIVWDD